MITLEAVMAWITLLPKVVDGGKNLFDVIKAVLVNNGIDHDTAALDAAILDADKRKAIADAEAKGTPA
jgi:hypothetical protein